MTARSLRSKVAPRQVPTKQASVKIEKPFIPWSLPAAVFFVFGIIMARQGLPWFIALASTASFGFALFAAAPRYARLFLPLVLLLPLGYGWFSQWAA